MWKIFLKRSDNDNPLTKASLSVDVLGKDDVKKKRDCLKESKDLQKMDWLSKGTRLQMCIKYSYGCKL